MRNTVAAAKDWVEEEMGELESSRDFFHFHFSLVPLIHAQQSLRSGFSLNTPMCVSVWYGRPIVAFNVPLDTL